MGGNSYEVIRIRIRASPASRASLGTTRTCCASDTACGRRDAMQPRQNGPSDRSIAVLTQSICRSGNKKRQLGHRVLDPDTAVHRLPMHAACLASAKTRPCLDMTHCRRCKKMLYSERYKPADN